jgi:hypothetical protein
VVTAFREGGRVLGRSALEAPTWASERVERAARRWAETGGRSADPGEETDAETARWLDRAAHAVEERLGRLGQSYLAGLVRAFERRFRDLETRRAAQAAAPPTPGK